MSDKRIASQVLDYWFAIEFLGQDSLDTITDRLKLERELKKFKKSDASEKNRRKQISVFDEITGEKDIYAIIADQAKACNMKTWGNLTFFIGKIKRQACIEKLANEFGVNLEQAEKNAEYIPILSFQCNNKGVYIQHSLSLSTIVWALSQVSGKGNIKISDVLSEKAYSETLEGLEKKFFDINSDSEAKGGSSDTSENADSEDETSNGNVRSNQERQSDTPEFSEVAISIDSLKKIFNELTEEYQKYIAENSFEAETGVKYQLFKDSKAKDKYDDDNYMGLSHDFFSSDLKMIKEYIEKGTFDFSQDMLSDLISYICAPYERMEEKKKHDFVKPRTEEELFNEFSEILNLRNSPIGKWPSRYMPALMQQVAINFAVSNESRGIFEENGKIFSVNGPPGTGKTTLLKEVIANNIVEKAVLLSQYDDPDDAFTGVRFKHGKLNGAYAQYYPKWFRFKDEHISDYGVLVTSCNNAAVENITTELPLESGILDNLKARTDGQNADSIELQDRLSEIRKVFSTDEAEEKIEIYTKDSKRHAEYSEIYFTGYARNFLGNNEELAKAWGLVAAPLGKKSNISKFYYDVLYPVWQDFMMANKSIEDRIPRYKKAKKAFCEQYKKAKNLQSSLATYGEAVHEAHNAAIRCQKKEQEGRKFEGDIRVQLSTLEGEINSAQQRQEKDAENLRGLVAKCAEIDQRIKLLEQKVKEFSDQELEYRKQASEAENSVSVLTKIFRKERYNSAIELAQTYRARVQECLDAASAVKKSLNDENVLYAKTVSDKDNASQILDSTQKEIDELKKRKTELQQKTAQLKAAVDKERVLANAAQEKRDRLVSEYVSAGELHTGKILDENFIKNVLSEDEAISTSAQIVNPWSTEEYNLEREKLFYLALQMTKEFLLSSKSCRANLCILGQYWGLRTESGTEKISFHPGDKEAMIGSLFNTLFLLTPVVSSTFASVGRLLRDIKEPGVIGTLVIDEAGQAQPQMAVGALFRSKKAIIVGDPKQVEPVVTDDLKLLKEAYTEPVYSNYKDKTLSVQSCADIINHFGTFFDNGTDYPEWVGCPLLVHRRCISPMYEISNRISYNGIMKQQTLVPSEEKIKTFISGRSQWINVTGSEKGSGDHYVPNQGEIVCRMVDEAFNRSETPSLYIITPFTKVVSGIRSALGTYANRNRESALAKSRTFGDWLYANIGTVHKFQGKEANEVIFMLGCDETVKERYAVKGFVNSNIVNVAATRAKYRLYIVGNIKVWKNNRYVKEAKDIIDTLPIENISQIECWEESEEKNAALLAQASQLPLASSFVSEIGTKEEGEPEYEIESDGFVFSIDEAGFLSKDLSDEQYREFGFVSKENFNELPVDVKKNLLMGMKLYYLLRPIYAISDDLDASCCGILFCKAMELYLRKNFAEGLKARFPDYSIKNSSNQMIQLQNASDRDFMIGTVQYILKNKANEISSYMMLKGHSEYSVPWWNSFNAKLKSFVNKRNKCCHPQWFKWNDMRQLLGYEFKEDGDDVDRTPKIGGVFYESETGRKLSD